MKVIGVTGNSGSGKSSASDYFKNKGGFVIDLDRIGHGIYENEKCLKEVRSKIPGDFIEDGKVVRSKLSSIVFSDYVILKKLTSITDKYIYNETKEILKNCKDAKFAILDGALIFDSKVLKLCDSIIVVDAKIDTKISRIMNRDKISYDMAFKRINSQKDYSQYKHHSKFVILNDNTKEEFREKIGDILDKILK